MTDSSLGEILAKNIKTLREKRPFSQEDLAKQSGLPRSTIASIESGSANPSLNTMVALADGLQVTLDELISRPRSLFKFIKSTEVPKNKKAKGSVVQHKLLPDPIKGMEIDRIDISPGSRMRGVPHMDQTREYLYCIEGKVELFCDGEKFELSKGDVLAFPGDLIHSYFNSGSKQASCLSVVVLAGF